MGGAQEAEYLGQPGSEPANPPLMCKAGKLLAGAPTTRPRATTCPRRACPYLALNLSPLNTIRGLVWAPGLSKLQITKVPDQKDFINIKLMEKEIIDNQNISGTITIPQHRKNGRPDRAEGAASPVSRYQ